jgi:hypothetical protein
MQNSSPADKDFQICVEFKDIEIEGFQQLGRWEDTEYLERSSEAVNKAMSTIRAMAIRTIKTIRLIEGSDRPEKVEVTFGLKLTADANAFVTSAGIESQIGVTLTWDKSKSSEKS